MTLSPAKKLAIVVAVQLLILASVIGFKQYTVWTGTTVLLKVEPVDPTDPFRGDYLTVRYEISDIDRGLIDEYIDDTGYVELQKGEDGYWHAVAVHDRRGHDFDDTVIIRGEPDYNQYSRTTLHFEYGIEDLFIPEGSGDQVPFGDDVTVAVAVKVDRFGNAVPRYLTVDGERFDLKRR
jgi:uncharacterized membrane-anchored protein